MNGGNGMNIGTNILIHLSLIIMLIIMRLFNMS